MANTYVLIASNTLSSSAASVTFSSIPGTYTDLVLRVSARTTAAVGALQATIRVNSDTGSNYSYTYVRANTTNAQSATLSSQSYWYPSYGLEGTTFTSNTFSSWEMYLPSYTSSSTKPASVFGVVETNSANAYLGANALLWNSTSAITSIDILDADGYSFASGSSFWLYGIKKD